MLGLVKSLIFAKFLGFESLGFLSLFQSAMALFATVHFGILTGGYRLASYYNDSEYSELNSVIYSSIFLLFPIFLLLIKLTEAFSIVDSISNLTYLALLAGFISIFANWAINVSVAKKDLISVNKAQFLGGVISLISVSLIFTYDVYGAYFSIIVQPFIIVVYLMFNTTYTLPKSINFDLILIKKIFKMGFYPFIAGLFFIAYQQLEKIFIGYTLGVDQLGHLTIFYLVLTVWVIIPDALTRIYYPKATKLYESKDIDGYHSIIEQHLKFALCYAFFCSLVIYFFLDIVVQFVLNEHLNYVYLVKLGIVVFFLRTVSDNYSIRLLATGSNSIILYADVISFILYSVVFIFCVYTFELKLMHFIYLSMLYYLVKMIIFLYFSSKINLKE